jgi:peptidoglycan hydrolase-like protein with peptidoglycan-binding domain
MGEMSERFGAWHAGVVDARVDRRRAATVVTLVAAALLGLGLWALGQEGALGQWEHATGTPVALSPDETAAGAEREDAPGDPEATDVGDDGPAATAGEPDGSEPDGADDAEPEGADGEDEPEPDPQPVVDVAAVQRQLADLGLYLGAADGVQGQQTTAAIMAFQRINEIQVDGVIGPQTLGALESPRAPQVGDGPATRIDVDLTRQLLHLIEDGTRVVTLHISSGSGQPYATSSGGTAYGNTPIGSFVVERRIAGERKADLGILYDPLYYYRGWAIHGSNSVPAHPASHGCIRVTRADARWLFDRVPNGIPVVLHGGQHVFVPSGG